MDIPTQRDLDWQIENYEELPDPAFMFLDSVLYKNKVTGHIISISSTGDKTNGL